MKTWMHIATIAMLTLTVPACVGADGTDELEEDGEESVAQTEDAVSCSWNYILHYNYTDDSGTYRWHASQNLTSGKWYIDERRIGGGFYKQYSLTPGWNVCPPSPQTITLKSGTQTLVGPHNCLPSGNEEVHLEKQRLLVPQAPFATYECL